MNHFTCETRVPQVCSKPLTIDNRGGNLTSDAGVSLLAAANSRMKLTAAIAACILDSRQASKITHSLEAMVSQRVIGIASGYEDCNDHDTLRSDPAHKIANGFTPDDRDGATQSTLSRFENSVSEAESLAISEAMARCVIEQLAADTKSVTLDMDDTVDPVHGDQQLALFNGNYGTVCYLPRLVHLTDDKGNQFLLQAMLRSGTAGSQYGESMLRKAIELVRERFPGIRIIVRGDAGFGGNLLCSLCEELKVGYTFRFTSNTSLKVLAEKANPKALKLFFKGRDDSDQETLFYDDFYWQASNWETSRHIIVKTVVKPRDSFNRYFMVADIEGDYQNEDIFNFYHWRGEQENRIKEFKCDLRSDRTSCQNFAANQFRLQLHCAANILWNSLQRVLKEVAPNTHFATAQIATLQRDLIKVGARIIERSKHIWVRLSSTYRHYKIFCKLQLHFSAVFG